MELNIQLGSSPHTRLSVDSMNTPQQIRPTCKWRTPQADHSQQVVESMADNLWADSPGSISGCVLAGRLSEEWESPL